MISNFDMESLSSFIKRIAPGYGFFKAGIARADKLKGESVFLTQWIDEVRNAGMKWMGSNIDKRTDPSLIMEEVKSVISLAYLYDTPVSQPEDRNIPKISRYAWGRRDYHKIIKKKLKDLCREMEGLYPGLKTKYYIDDGPVMDKVWAVRSGVGWMGKNTNVINKDAGSFFFLATVLINAETDYDEPVEDLCKNCVLCINECPTGALYDEYKLDSNLCISYLTIENRSDIPDKTELDGWIFGCDVCQEVCPYNGRKIFTEDTDFMPRQEIFGKTFDELLSLDESDFNKMSEGTPIRRTKYSGWKRNLLKAKPIST